jgi:hypothetical protein
MAITPATDLGLDATWRQLRRGLLSAVWPVRLWPVVDLHRASRSIVRLQASKRIVQRSTCLREIVTHDWPSDFGYAVTARGLLSEEKYQSTTATSRSAGTSPTR